MLNSKPTMYFDKRPAGTWKRSTCHCKPSDLSTGKVGRLRVRGVWRIGEGDDKGSLRPMPAAPKSLADDEAGAYAVDDESIVDLAQVFERHG